VALAPTARGEEETMTPTDKVIEMISQLQQKMIGKGEDSQKVYNEFAAWCTQRAQELGHEIKDGNAATKDLEGQIQQGEATIEAKEMKIEGEAEDITTASAELDKATAIRKKEHEDFLAEEKELVDVIGILKKAKAVLEKEMAKHGASMLQTQSVSTVAQALQVMVDATLVSSKDAAKLQSLIQDNQMNAESDADGDETTAAPAVGAYQGASGGIIQVITDMLEKSEKRLEEARAVETTAQGNFKMLEQSLKDEITFSDQDKDEAAQVRSAAKEEKSADKGDLGMTVAEVQADVKTLDDLRRVCLAKVEEFQAMAKSRDEELKALAEAKKVIKETMGGASDVSYGKEAALLQVAAAKAKVSLKERAAAQATNEALRKVHQLAKQQGGSELAQLASRMSAAIRAGAATGDDPFAKIIGMISDMITKLEQEASEDAEHEAYCDKETADANEKKDQRTDTVEKLTTKMHQMKARSKKLKDQVVSLQKSLSELASSQAEMDKIRSEEHADFLDEKSALDKGMEGVKMALKTLRDYYGKSDKAHQTSEGAGDNIISLLETIESDFSQSLAELRAGEQRALSDYDTETQDNKVDKEEKETQVEHKTKEFTSLDKSVADLTSDRAGVQSELDAVVEYLAKLKKECIVMPDSYEERKKRREAEIAGLKDALNTLESETALIQKSSSRRVLRGSRQHSLS